MTKSKTLPTDKEMVLCLRTVDQFRCSYNNFQWPELGYVEAPDFDKIPEPGRGLHGYLRGCGDGIKIRWKGLFQVVKVIEEEIISLGQQVKFPRCEVIFTGDRYKAIETLVKTYPGLPIIGACITSTDSKMIEVGCKGMAKTGNGGTSIAGHMGVAITGTNGTAQVGNYGEAMAGDYGKAIGGYRSTVIAGRFGTAVSGIKGIAMSDEGGTISLLYRNNGEVQEIKACIGDNGILPNIQYCLNDKCQFVKAK